MTLDELQTERDKDGFIVLKKTYSDLYKKMSYLTPIPAIQNRIFEYDIKSANVSMLRASGKVNEDTLCKLEELDKSAREVAVGMMIKRDKNVWKIIKKGIARAREDLFAANQIQDSEVVSIHNDAVLISGRKLKVTKFGPVEFKLKKQYAAFQQINKVELYYDRKNGTVDIKGVRDSITEEEDHQNGMIQFFARVFEYLVYDQRDALRKYLIDFSRDYKAKRLPYQYYRELSSDNCYRTIFEVAGFDYNLIDIGDADLDIINPVFNYRRYILPIIQQYT